MNLISHVILLTMTQSAIGVDWITDEYSKDYNVCLEPFTPLPVYTEFPDGTNNGNGKECYECELYDINPVVNADTCNKTKCAGIGYFNDGATCYKWHIKYAGEESSHIRAGCSVRCNIEYEEFMCQGVGERLYEFCKFNMCEEKYCNEDTRPGWNIILVQLFVLTALYHTL